MKRYLFLTLAAVLIAGLAQTASAQRKKAKPEEPKKKIENPERSRGTELNLSDEQKQKLVQIRRQAAKEQIRLSADKKIAALELHEMLQADQPNQAMLDRKIEQLAQLNSQLTKNRLQTGIATRSVLTKEQRMAARQMMGRRMARMHGQQRMKIFRFRRGPGGPAGGPGMMWFQNRGKKMGMEQEEMMEERESSEPEDSDELGIFEGTGLPQQEGLAELNPMDLGEPDEFEQPDGRPFDWEDFDEPAPMPGFHPFSPDDDGWQ